MAKKAMGARLQAARKTAGLSARELDGLADLGLGHVAMIERGANCSCLTALRLAQVLGATMDWLVGGIGEGPSSEVVARAVKKAKRAASRGSVSA